MDASRNALIVISALLIVFGAVAAFSQERAAKQEALGQSGDVSRTILAKQSLIEAQYPEFRDFENQESFAGKAVTHKQVGDDFYFAYLVMGSGLPIVQGTCFHVDHSGAVTQVGTFPDMLDSYAGYPAVNPVTCKGEQ